MKSLVVYYSRKGSNKFLAQKIAADKGSDIVELKPLGNSLFSIIISSLFKTPVPLQKISADIASYDSVYVCGPIYMGQLISPLATFIKKNKKSIKSLHFVTCCGGGEAEKDGKFGYNSVFSKVKEIAGPACLSCEAFPIDLIIPDELRGNDEAVMNVRLSSETFSGAIVERYNQYIQKM